MFRGWSRLCRHVASLNAVEGASAEATAVARVAKAEEKDKAIAADSAGNAAALATSVKEGAMREVSTVSTLASKQKETTEKSERGAREQQEHRALLLVRTMCVLCGVSRLTREINALYVSAAWLLIYQPCS